MTVSRVKRDWRVLRRFRRSSVGLFGAAIILLFLLAAVFAPKLAPYDPDEVDLFNVMRGPSAEHWLGLDQFGRDMFSRIIYGSRTSLAIGTAVVAASGLVGIMIGTISGYFRGVIDRLVVPVVDILMTLPSILVALGVVTILGPGLRGTMIAIGVTMVPRFVRVARAAALQIRNLEYVQSAHALGMSQGRVILRYMVPNMLAPLLVQGSLFTAEAVLIASGLGFLGLGVQPPQAEWGQMLAEGRGYLQVAPHISLFPGFAIMLMVLGFNLLGDGLRDALDIRLSS